MSSMNTETSRNVDVIQVIGINNVIAARFILTGSALVPNVSIVTKVCLR